MNNPIKKKLTILLLLVCAIIGCTNNDFQRNAYADADGYSAADSIISDIGDAREFPRLLVVTDSFLKAGDITPVRAIFYKTIAYNIMGQQSKALSLYYKLDNMDVKKLKTTADLESYIYSFKDYIRLLCDMKRYDRVLREAYHADRKLKEAGYDSFIDHQDIAQMIGECQLNLNQVDEAAASFKKSMESMNKRLVKNHDPLDLLECQKTMNAIARAYIHTNRYNEAIPWIKGEDTMFVSADIHPNRDSVFVDEMMADINYTKALLAHAQGDTKRAEVAYNTYLSTKKAKLLGSIINSNEYLLMTERYKEAADNYGQLEKFLRERGYKCDLEVIGQYMIPKYRANILAGRRDSALQVASLIAEYYDTALVRQKMIDADLISTIYDTEGKERQIAEQSAKISHQRFISGIVVMVIILVFFHIYSMQRRKAYKRLDETNRQLDAINRELMLANARAEESSRVKAQFIQQISHEVRTPLNVLSGFSQVLATPDIEIDGDELQHISQKIMENSERITRLVDKMLDLSIINSNTNLDCSDDVNVAEVVEEAVKNSGIREADHLDFQLELSKEVESVTFKANHQATVKALTMLLDNAIKFTHPHAFRGRTNMPEKPRVALSVTTTQEQVMFVLEDTGIGIPAGQAENIFTEFVQLDEYTDGTGIGLSIARSLVRHMEGDIMLDTSYADGARFVMTLKK
jgi:signal transduction histidine kinase